MPSPSPQAESFPLTPFPEYHRVMYPPRVSDHDIQLLIHELSAGEQLPSGAQLRAALQQRFASRGGVTRIYRLLANARSKASPQNTATPKVENLQREMETLRQAVQLADHREHAHQSRWALEVDRLRQQVATLEPLALQTKAALATAELLRRQLHAAHIRIAALEQQLLEAQAIRTPAKQGTTPS